MGARLLGWPAALAAYKHTESAATVFSPEAIRNAEFARIWRGMGYAPVETKKIAEAKALYRKCLELEQNDAAARRELQYVQTLKAKRP